jgi:hypothetical protein
MPVGAMARARHFPALDGGLNVDVGVHGAFGLEVAHGGDAMVEGEARVTGGEHRAIGNRLFQELFVVFRRRDVALEEDVGVGIDEPGQHRGPRKVDQFNPRRRRTAGGDRRDLVALDQDEGIRHRGPSPGVDQMPGANGDAFGCYWLGGNGENAGRQQQKEREATDHEVPFHGMETLQEWKAGANGEG